MNIPAVSVVTIKSKTPLYKNGEEAQKIELINLEEVGFDLVSQKDLYRIGDRAVFIQPDYCLSDKPIFEDFIRPGGDESKSMLGKVEGKPRRIRAKRFNFTKEVDLSGDKVYSNGILLPINLVYEYVSKNCKGHFLETLSDRNLQEDLGITKYEEPETNGPSLKNSGSTSSFPEGVYKTDEPNIFNMMRVLKFPIELIGTEKVDGSSITIGIVDGDSFICSRNIRKNILINVPIGIRPKRFSERTFLEKLQFWKSYKITQYETQINDGDSFVKYGYPYAEFLLKNDLNNFILRGELNGKSCKGSGNKNNPSSKLENNIKFFGVDIWNGKSAERMNTEDFVDFALLHGLPRCKSVFSKKFYSFEDLISECTSYFRDNMVEGIVVRDVSGKFSAKVMNLEYDSKK